MMPQVTRESYARGKHRAMLNLPACHPVGRVFDESGEAHHDD
jgi:hypothetical protein